MNSRAEGLSGTSSLYGETSCIIEASVPDTLSRKILLVTDGIKRIYKSACKHGKTRLNGPTKGELSGSRVGSGARRTSDPSLGGSRSTRAS